MAFATGRALPNHDEPDLKAVTYFALSSVYSKIIHANNGMDAHLAIPRSASVAYIPTTFYSLYNKVGPLKRELTKNKQRSIL